MKEIKTLKGVSLIAAISLLPLSQAALGEVTISGWINEGVQFYDDGESTSDFVQSSDNGHTLGSRITFSGSSEVAPGLTGGFEVIVEPQSVNTPLISANQSNFDETRGASLGVLGSSLNIGGAWGKVTVGLQSMPTDNIAVLEDPSLTLWSGISPVFRGNGFSIQSSEHKDGKMVPGVLGVIGQAGSDAGAISVSGAGAGAFGVGVGVAGGGAAGAAAGAGAYAYAYNSIIYIPAVEAVAEKAAVWGDFLNCFTGSELRGAGGIGIDCNGVYRNGIRYDLPAFGPVTVAVGYANDDIFDVSAKYKQDFGQFKGSLALGYAVNNGVNPSFAAPYDEASNFQLQAGLMHSASGVFGSIAYQHEEADLVKEAKEINKYLDDIDAGQISDDSDAWWLKVGVKRPIFSVGDTSVSFDYGQYHDQYGTVQAQQGVTGSEVERMGVSIDQYFGSNLIIYGKWEQLDLDMDHRGVFASSLSVDTEELNTYTLGATYFF